ncbi:MAG: DUF4838 domain-containing protein [Lentisphaeria bacterium]|nr:DUF4838 domain-containing protein [Lentisphaeria bacterium]
MRIFSWLFAALLAAALTGLQAAEKPFVFARGGKARCVIALPDGANKFDRMAAADLQNYLSRMTGAEFAVVPESKVTGNAVYVGQSKAAAEAAFPKFADEEWCISSPDGKTLILTGSRKIGGFYAAWALLNKLGCYALTLDQDAVPREPDLVYGGAFERKKPAFAGRLIYDGYPHVFQKIKADKSVVDAYVLWLLRNRINGEQTKRIPSLYTYGSYHLAQSYPYHTLDLFVPPEKYFKTHPEYFAMDAKGKRFPPERPHVGGSLCMSNPEVAEVTLRSLREMIREDHAKNPPEERATVYDISRLDRMPYICKCPKCLAVIKEEGTELGLQMRYINAVASQIAKEYPGIIIRTNGTLSTCPPPTKTLPVDNVLIRLGDRFTVSDPFRPLLDPVNAGSRAALESWNGKAKKMALWDYWNLGGDVYFNPPRVETVFDSLKSDFRYLRSIGFSDLFIEASRDYAAPQNFIDAAYFTANHLMVDPDADPEKLADVFFEHYYGPAAPVLRKWFDEIRAGIKKHPGRQPSYGAATWCYMDVPFLFNAYWMLKKAAESLPGNSVYRKRVEFERIPVVWAILAQRHSFRSIFRKNGLNVDDLTGECRELVKKHIRRFPAAKPEIFEKRFEKRFLAVASNLKRPEKFKDVPDEKFRMIAFPHFTAVKMFDSGIAPDPDSIQGKALKSASTNPDMHGVNRIIPGKHRFRTTFFQLRNGNNLGGQVSILLKKVPQDEKYHWYRLPGKIELKHKSSFWGQGWAIQARTNHLYALTDGTPADNMWDEVWMSAKFTGPAYVPGSTKENAIWIDMVVLTKK